MRAPFSPIPSRHGLGLLRRRSSATSITGPGARQPQRPRTTVGFLNGGALAKGGDFSHAYGSDLFWLGLRRSDPIISLRSGGARLSNDGVGGFVAFVLCLLKGVGGANLKQGGDGDGSATLLLIGVFYLQYAPFGMTLVLFWFILVAGWVVGVVVATMDCWSQRLPDILFRSTQLMLLLFMYGPLVWACSCWALDEAFGPDWKFDMVWDFLMVWSLMEGVLPPSSIT